MSDENISQEKISSETSNEKPIEVKKHSARGKRGALENLPNDVKADMEKHMIEVSAYSCKDYMTNTYGKEFPILSGISRTAYMHYQKRHRARITKELALQQEISNPPEQMMMVINSITSPEISLEDKRKALSDLFEVCQARRKLLEIKNQTYIDPMIEALILANAKEQRVIIEKVTQLSEQLEKDAAKDYLTEFQSFYQVIIASVNNIYRMVNGTHNYSEFIALLDSHMEIALKQYGAEKELLLKKPT